MCFSFSEVAAEIGFSVCPLGDEESSSYSQLSMESETDNSRSTADNRRESESRGTQSDPCFPPYMSCRGCGHFREEPLGPYCLRCCRASREAKSTDFCSPFGSGSALRSGLQIHKESQPDCEGLGNGVGDKEELSAEDKLLKQHSCHLCGFSSRYANHVKRHMKTHNGEKPFNCPLCTYASAQLVNLQRHLRIHTGEKPYVCDSCSFACSSLGNLKRHQRMHVPNVPQIPTAGGQQDNPPQPACSQNSLKRPVSEQRPNEEVLGASGKAPCSYNASDTGSQNGGCGIGGVV